MRPATGTVKWRRNVDAGRMQWFARLTLASGARPWVDLDPSIAEDDVAGAKRCALIASEQARRDGVVQAHVKETVREYAKRWLASREGRVRSNQDNRAHLETHILPVLGAIDMRAIERDEIERLVAKLDAKIEAGMGSKTGQNVYGTCTCMFGDATYAKPGTGLRCLEVDPTRGVRGPNDDGTDKLLQFLYPSEFSTFMACPDVPRSWRRDVAIAVYLCLRDGEHRALQWPAVDLEHGVVTVAEAFIRRLGKAQDGTKSGAARQVPIPAPLLPLLQAMKKAAGGKGLVCNLPSYRNMPRGLRHWLTVAKVDRDSLHASTRANKPLRWHDLRATGLTWYAVEGRSPTEIRDIAGHTQTSMTDRYMRAAGVLRGGRFGEVFPPLPEPSELLLPVSSRNRPETKPKSASGDDYRYIQRRGRDSNPRRSFSPAPA
jgi:integrase